MKNMTILIIMLGCVCMSTPLVAQTSNCPAIANFGSDCVLGGEVGAAAQSALQRLYRPPFDSAAWLRADLTGETVSKFDPNFGHPLVRPFKNFSGDVSGRFLEIMALNSRGSLGVHPALKALLTELPRYQREGGYFAASGTVDWEKPIDGTNFKTSVMLPALWGNARILCGLIACARSFGDKECLAAAKRLGDFYGAVLKRFTDPDRVAEYRRGDTYAAGYVTCYFPAMEGLVKLHELTGEAKYLDTAVRMAAFYRQFDKLPIDHAHGMLCSQVGLLLLHEATRDVSYLTQVESRWETLVDGGYINPLGGILEKCHPTYAQDEGCALADWLRLNLELGRVTGRTRYYAMAERVLHNHFLQNQASTGGFGSRRTICDRVGVTGLSEKISEATWCCDFHGVLAFRLLSDYAVQSTPAGITIPMALDFCSVRKGGTVTSSMEPGAGTEEVFRQVIRVEGAPAVIRVRQPHWAQALKLLAADGREIATKADGDFLATQAPVNQMTVVYLGGIYLEDRRCKPLSQMPATGTGFVIGHGPKILAVPEGVTPKISWPMTVGQAAQLGMKPLTRGMAQRTVRFVFNHSESDAKLPELAVAQLRCEYLENPEGCDVAQPRLSWVLESPRRGESQSAYRVLVASRRDLLDQDQGDLWDSGKVASDQSVQVPYQGKALESRMRCYWKVKSWTTSGEAWSKPASWSMGLLQPGDWKGIWIGWDEPWEIPATALRTMTPADEIASRRLPARYLRREFQLQKKVARATAYVCGLGFFDLFLNGHKVSDHVMDPALSDYRKAAYYVTFDLTRELQGGTNTLGVMLGNGRFFAPRLIRPAPTVNYGFPKLLLQLEVEYADGSCELVTSDEHWRLTSGGPLVANNEYDGESYDARLEMPGWNRNGFDDARWVAPQKVKPPGGVLRAQMIEPMRVTQVLKPVAITHPKPGVHVVDFGQSFYGNVRLKLSGPRGTEIRMAQAYSLKPDGTLKSEDNRSARATDTYILKGGGEEAWSPQFKGQGFRYVQVTGFPGIPTAGNFEGLVIHTDFPVAGEFVCSNDLVNRIHSAVRWGIRAYVRSAPMEPDRDERQPWTGDPARDAESEAFNFNVAPFYRKWLEDVARSQRADGTIPDVSMNWEWGNGVVWPSVFTIIPEWMLDFYGDGAVLKTHYDAMKKWVEAVHKLHRLPDGTFQPLGHGDWCDAATMDGKCDDFGATPKDLLFTAYHYHNCRIMARAAQHQGNAVDATTFTAWADAVRSAFNKKFFNATTATYANGTQCAYILPLAFGMVPNEHRARVIANLADEILVKNQGHPSVGLVGMQWLMPTLTEIGRPDLGWTIVTKTTRPSWGYMIGKGSTTIWERWDTDTRGPGMNSEALLILVGTLDAWFYQTLAGINYDPEKPGFKNIILRPHLLGDLKFVQASFDSMYGRIESGWKIEGGTFRWKIRVPANTTAAVYLPAADEAGVTESGKALRGAEGVRVQRVENGRVVLSVGSGVYEFAAPMKEAGSKMEKQL